MEGMILKQATVGKCGNGNADLDNNAARPAEVVAVVTAARYTGDGLQHTTHHQHDQTQSRVHTAY